MRAYIAATEERRVELDWDAAERVAQFGNGVPEAVSVAGSVSAARDGDRRGLAAIPAARTNAANCSCICCSPPSLAGKKNRQRVAVLKKCGSWRAASCFW